MALDKVDNTLGHQVAYLSDWAKRSYDTIKLELPKLIFGSAAYNVLQQDVKTIEKAYDLAYFDPPYGTNNQVTKTTRVRYASYYHIWTTICKNDKPEVKGKANRRADVASDKCPGAISAYESTKDAVVQNEIKELINAVKAKYIVFSYSSKSKVPIDVLRDIFCKYKLLQEERFSYKENAMKSLTMNKQWLGDMSENNEFLFLIEK